MARTLRALLILVAGAATLAAAYAGPALAGGGCAPSREHSRGEGDRVTIQGCAFSPTLLFVAPGTTVRWTHADHVPHNVVGVGWGGAETIAQTQTATQRFERPGIYPYQCSLHPGMSGAVIVGQPDLAAAEGEARVAGASAERRGEAPPAADLSLALAVAAGAATLLGGIGLGRRLVR